MPSSRQVIRSFICKYFLSTYCVAGAGRRGRGGRPGVVLGGCDRPGLRAQREEAGVQDGFRCLDVAPEVGTDRMEEKGVAQSSPALGWKSGMRQGCLWGRRWVW